MALRHWAAEGSQDAFGLTAQAAAQAGAGQQDPVTLLARGSVGGLLVLFVGLGDRLLDEERGVEGQ